MICTGTGIAPFIGFLQHLQVSSRPKMLIYGHRTFADRLYAEELCTFVNDGLVLIECFSQQDCKYHYVYQALQHDERVQKYLQGSVYVCGSMKMAKSVLPLVPKTATSEFW
jgi:sulfite reductase (NADPH) flavoprotein alpha-component